MKHLSKLVALVNLSELSKLSLVSPISLCLAVGLVLSGCEKKPVEACLSG